MLQLEKDIKNPSFEVGKHKPAFTRCVLVDEKLSAIVWFFVFSSVK